MYTLGVDLGKSYKSLAVLADGGHRMPRAVVSCGRYVQKRLMIQEYRKSRDVFLNKLFKMSDSNPLIEIQFLRRRDLLVFDTQQAGLLDASFVHCLFNFGLKT